MFDLTYTISDYDFGAQAQATNEWVRTHKDKGGIGVGGGVASPLIVHEFGHLECLGDNVDFEDKHVKMPPSIMSYGSASHVTPFDVRVAPSEPTLPPRARH